MTATAKKDNTVKFRIDPATASLLERACRYVEMNKSQFVRLSVQEKAKSILAQHEQTHFSTEDWERFFALLDHPPKPTPRMRKAAEKYREIAGSNEI